ncbi:MAG: hypothetical protein KJ938_02205 [Actinobacteria bacterium]|nr:hypothetical protein [Actinomycetota bacterium]
MPPVPGPDRVRALAALLPLALLSGCAAPAGVPDPLARSTQAEGLIPHDPDALTVLELRFDDWPGPHGSIMATTASTGTAQVDVAVVTAAGGRVRRGPGLTGDSARLPGLAAAAPRSAGLVVRVPRGEADPLSPGDAAFTVGADFRLDKTSDGLSTDDGDNLVQRGLYADSAQYKLQVDHGVGSCRVAGEEGALVARLDEAVDRRRWYRLTCTRNPAGLTLSLRPLEGRRAETSVATADGATGAVSFPRRTPLTVGTKVGDDGEITVSSTDQLNGWIDNVVVAVSDPQP